MPRNPDYCQEQLECSPHTIVTAAENVKLQMVLNKLKDIIDEDPEVEALLVNKVTPVVEGITTTLNEAVLPVVNKVTAEIEPTVETLAMEVARAKEEEAKLSNLIIEESKTRESHDKQLGTAIKDLNKVIGTDYLGSQSVVDIISLLKTKDQELLTAIKEEKNIDRDIIDRLIKLEAIDHNKLAETASANAVATVVAHAPENLDSLNEIAKFIQSDQAEAAKLANRISELETLSTGLSDSINKLYSNIEGLSTKIEKMEAVAIKVSNGDEHVIIPIEDLERYFAYGDSAEFTAKQTDNITDKILAHLTATFTSGIKAGTTVSLVKLNTTEQGTKYQFSEIAGKATLNGV